ncbi:MAG: metallophosphoesterase [Clostridia bacterium]|nr:metallophosphoesterase [Clostridia bacterium]
MKLFLVSMLLFLGLLLLPDPCSADTRIVVASDLHYLSRELIDDEGVLMRVIRASDGKVTHYSPEIARAFIDKMLEEKPDAVILCGDLTLNGSYESHEELINLLRVLPKNGIPVLVLSGNHDSTGTAYRFAPDGIAEIEAMDDEEFIKAYAEFGYAQAISRDAVSFSYVYEAAEKLRILMLDVNSNHTYGTVRDETFAWMEEQLLAANLAEAQVIAVTHQNLHVHNRMFIFGYQINNAGKLLQLYQKYGVELNLSGHMHLQHIVQKGNVTDIATSALSVWPCHYAVLTVKADSLAYEAKELDVAAWAEEQGITGPDLLDFYDYSRDFFDDTTRTKQESRLDGCGASPEETERMIRFAADRNRAIFRGYPDTDLDMEALDLWQKYMPGSFSSVYMQEGSDESVTDMRYLSLP